MKITHSNQTDTEEEKQEQEEVKKNETEVLGQRTRKVEVVE